MKVCDMFKVFAKFHWFDQACNCSSLPFQLAWPAYFQILTWYLFNRRVIFNDCLSRCRRHQRRAWLLLHLGDGFCQISVKANKVLWDCFFFGALALVFLLQVRFSCLWSDVFLGFWLLVSLLWAWAGADRLSFKGSLSAWSSGKFGRFCTKSSLLVANAEAFMWIPGKPAITKTKSQSQWIIWIQGMIWTQWMI